MWTTWTSVLLQTTEQLCLPAQQGSLSQTTQRQASLGMPPAMSSGLSQTAWQASLGLPQGPGTIGSATRQSSLGLPQSQGSLGLAHSGSLGAAQRQGSLGLPQGMGQGSGGRGQGIMGQGSGSLPYEPSAQDLQVGDLHLLQPQKPSNDAVFILVSVG